MTIPFTICRIGGGPLSVQIANGIREAIANGVYRPGDVLPTRRQFAEALGVSERAPREAVAALAAEGLVYTRRCLGCVVAEKGTRNWLGRVLFIESEDFPSYYHATLFSAFCRKMSNVGYLVTGVVCTTNPGGRLDLAPLEESLRQPFDFIVSIYMGRRVVSTLERYGKPFLALADSSTGCSHLMGRLTIACDEALREFAERCVAAKVRTVLQVGLSGGDEILDLRKCLTYTPVKLTSWPIDRARGRIGIEAITYGVMRAFSERLRYDRSWLPDVLFFRDDYVAAGALAALTGAGVRIPEDVRVVTLSNKGNCPVYHKPLTRIEIDPVANGTAFAAKALALMNPKRFRASGEIGYRYVQGEAFP